MFARNYTSKTYFKELVVDIFLFSTHMTASGSSQSSLELRERLEVQISKMERLNAQCVGAMPTVESVITLGRRIAPYTIPPPFIRFSTESGPLEPMPARYRVPFPTGEEMRASILHMKQKESGVVPTAPTTIPGESKRQNNETKRTETPKVTPSRAAELPAEKIVGREGDLDEYADDF